MRFWMIVRMALGGLRRTPLRVTLTSIGVAIACGAIVSMVGFALGLQKQAEAPFKTLGLLNHIEVTPREDGDSEDAAELDDAMLDQFAAIPGVTMAYPDFRLSDIHIVFGENMATGTAFGVPREASFFGTMDDMLVAGKPFTLGRKPEAILGRRLAKDLGFPSPEEAVGQVATLEASGLRPEEAETFRYQRKQLSVSIVGVYSMPHMGRQFADRGLVLPVDMMKDIPGIKFASALGNLRAGRSGVRAGYERATVRVEHHSKLAAVQRRVRALGFQTHTLLSDLEEMRTFFIFMDVLLAAVGTVALVVAGLGIVNTLVMSVLERYQEIGVYKAIGASDRDLLVLFLSEAWVIGLVGGLGGLCLGRVVSWILEVAVNVYARGQGATFHLSLFAFPFWLLLGAVLFSVVVSVLAGVYPALRAARVDPIRALRSQ